MKEITINQIKEKAKEYCIRRRKFFDIIKMMIDCDRRLLYMIIDYQNQNDKTNDEIDKLIYEIFKEYEEVFNQSMYNATILKLENEMIDLFERKTKDEMAKQSLSDFYSF